MLFSFIQIYSQNTVKDSLSQEKIPFVEIYSDNGDLIGVTDKDGIISEDLNKEIILSNSNLLTFVHSTFKNKIVTVDSFKKNSVVILNPIAIKLNEIVVNSKPNNYKYLKLKGYFRSVQSMKDVPLYFMDGIAEYYIPRNSSKVIMKIIFSRSLENRESDTFDPEYFPIKAGVPLLENFLNYEILSNEYVLKNSEKDIKLIFGKNDGIEMGTLSKFNENSAFQVELISPNKPKKINFLGIEVQYNNRIVNAVYDRNDFSKIGFDNLIHFKETMLFNYKIKKSMTLTKVDLTYEFFLLDKEFVNDKESKGSDSFYKFKRESYYQDKFWEYINNAFFQPLPESLKKYIEENLIEKKD